ncbi:MAG: YciI family protein [Proteobacteria bacterium]|nr:YciI family protein [Pseudomonadota bacterium]
MSSTQNHENSFEKIEGQRQIFFACLWKANESGERANEQFQERIPRLMQWLKKLRSNGNLVACGGGAFGPGSESDTGGGLTIIKAHSYKEALELSNGTPMNEIGTTTVLLWDIFYGSLSENSDWGDAR